MNQYIKRDMEAVVLKLSKQYPAILVTGPIQVGKTTMLQNLMKGTERNYVTLDNLEDRKLAKEDPEMFFQKYKTPILIDEIQYAPNLFTYIKIQIDKNKKAGEFWLTGSQIFKLMKGVTESLAGRMAILNLNSLSQNEIYNQYENKPFELDFEKLNENTLFGMHTHFLKNSLPFKEYESPNFFINSSLSEITICVIPNSSLRSTNCILPKFLIFCK